LPFGFLIAHPISKARTVPNIACRRTDGRDFKCPRRGDLGSHLRGEGGELYGYIARNNSTRNVFKGCQESQSMLVGADGLQDSMDRTNGNVAIPYSKRTDNIRQRPLECPPQANAGLKSCVIEFETFVAVHSPRNPKRNLEGLLDNSAWPSASTWRVRSLLCG